MLTSSAVENGETLHLRQEWRLAPEGFPPSQGLDLFGILNRDSGRFVLNKPAGPRAGGGGAPA